MVAFKVAKYNFCKYFGFERGSCCRSCSTQNACCSCILHKARMVHSMPATGDSKLQLKYDICGVSTNKFNSVYQILVKIINPKDDGWVLPHTMSPPRRGGCGCGGREERCTITCRRANAAHALSIDDGFLNMATNLPISAPLRNMKTRYKNQMKKGNIMNLKNINTSIWHHPPPFSPTKRSTPPHWERERFSTAHWL